MVLAIAQALVIQQLYLQDLYIIRIKLSFSFKSMITMEQSQFMIS
jgi:hypothetical protein